MTTKRVSFLTLNSATILSKLLYSSKATIKPINFFRSLTTTSANQRYDFQDLNNNNYNNNNYNNNNYNNNWDHNDTLYPTHPMSSYGHYPNVVQNQHTPTLAQYHHNQNNAIPQADSEKLTYQAPFEELDRFCMEGNVKQAVQILGLLQEKGIVLDLERFKRLMQLCGDQKALEEAKIVHQHIFTSLSDIKVSTYNKILEMYSRCGSMDDALSVFRKMPNLNLTSWDTIITWLAKYELGEDAIDLFTEFKSRGLKPDGEMFIGVFLACSVVGDSNEGMLHFETMIKEFGISPTMKHYVSIVDMLGYMGNLDEALDFVEKMPVEPSVDVWETLMNNCRIHGYSELGDRCAEIIDKLDPSHLNELSKSGLLPVKPSSGTSTEKKISNRLELRSRVREYRAGDRSHPDSDENYTLLRGMSQQMKEAGYIPETRYVLHDIDQEGKEEALLSHSERLAVAHGLMTSPARSELRIIKNLRVCGDCHSALKIISKIVGRKLVIRDAKRFHHFEHGLCSCKDYW
ncbi:hypothetical protein ACFE04_008771 [Oxalis oulophora]